MLKKIVTSASRSASEISRFLETGVRWTVMLQTVPCPAEAECSRMFFSVFIMRVPARKPAEARKQRALDALREPQFSFLHLSSSQLTFTIINGEVIPCSSSERRRHGDGSHSVSSDGGSIARAGFPPAALSEATGSASKPQTAD